MYIYICVWIYIYIILYYSILYNIILYYIVLYCMILYCIILYYITVYYKYIYNYIYTPDISCYICAPIIQPMFFWVVYPPVMKTRHLHPRALALDWKPLHLGQFCCQTSPNCWAVLKYSHIYIYMYIIYRSTVQNHC